MKKNKLRTGFQISFLIYILLVSLGHSFNWSFSANLHGICPFGAVETLHTYLTTDSFLHHIGTSNFVAISALFLTLIIAGAMFCGYICPLGTVQDYLAKLGKKLWNGRYFNRIPLRISNILSYFKYFFLAFILFQTSRHFSLVFEDIDPYYNLFNIWSDEIAIAGYISVAVFLLASLFVERPYCKYVCPLGAINGIFNKFSFFNIKRNANTCINCKKCDKACPMNIQVSAKEKISSAACIRCGKCIEACPVNDKDTLRFKSFGNKLAKEKYLYAIVPLIFLGIFFLGSTFGYMEEDEEEKLFNTANDIRGSYTLTDIVENYNLNEEELFKALGIPVDTQMDSKTKDLEEITGYSTENIRYLIENIDTRIGELVEDVPKWLDSNFTLRKAIRDNEPGRVMNYLIDSTTVELEDIDIKRKSMLVDIENYVDDYDAFLTYFNIPKDELKNSTMRDLEEKYGIKMEDIKTYLTEHKK